MATPQASESENPSRHTCPHCGAAVPDKSRGCRPLFSEVSFRELGDKSLYPVHRLTVSAYALQHPDEYCGSEKALATHLTGLCVAFEYNGDADLGRALKRWLDGNPAIRRIGLPEFRGTMTIADIHATKSSAEHAESVRTWAREVWESWAEHHDQIGKWVEEARLSRGHSPKNDPDTEFL